MLGPKPSILFIDAYDSFTNNIISLLVTALSCSVRVIYIDSPDLEADNALRDELRCYDAVVCGPGPGNPGNEKDVGIMTRIWQLADEDLVPVLGICLGFQSLGLAFGAHVRRLDNGLHGMIRRVRFRGEGEENGESDIFEGAEEIYATLYHSLCLDIGQDLIPTCRWRERRWGETANLEPLAWVEQDNVTGSDARILVAMKHRTKPFWGLQYHPESICTNKESKKVVINWFVAAQRWNCETGRKVCRDSCSRKGELPVRPSLLSQVFKRAREIAISPLEMKYRDCSFEYRTLDLPDFVSVIDIVKVLQSQDKELIVLESSNSHLQGAGAAAVRGRFSIIGLNVDEALKIECRANEETALLRDPTSKFRLPLSSYGGIWPMLADFLEKRRITNGNPDSPFWGGFMGYTTYEMGLYGLEASPRRNSGDYGHHPDLVFSWIMRSIVIDHFNKKIHIQCLQEDGAEGREAWFGQTTTALNSLSKPLGYAVYQNLQHGSDPAFVRRPDIEKYEAKVLDCQEYIKNGEAYEICLTDETTVVLPHVKSSRTLSSTSWTLYQKLRARQPAPFASFIRLGPLTFISCSPERFLKWDAANTCELRPMKGTVKKTAEVNSLAKAEALLQIPKEQAENLMIVDLVRHDLHSVCGAGYVTVPQLMVVEEYTSVFQMITVVQGCIPAVDDDELSAAEAAKARLARHTGVDVLAASLPPGSMTGAPKKRVCEILQRIESRERGLYSGVAGYMDVGGRGDFSVNIRCLFKYDGDSEPSYGFNDGEDERIDKLVDSRKVAESQDSRGTNDNADTAYGSNIEVWHVGAGGAVTALSTAVGEREEMETKLDGTLSGVFGLRDGDWYRELSN